MTRILTHIQYHCFRRRRAERIKWVTFIYFPILLLGEQENHIPIKATQLKIHLIY